MFRGLSTTSSARRARFALYFIYRPGAVSKYSARLQHHHHLRHATWINVQIMERFNAEGIDFAFPTQTLHLAGDDKHPLAIGERVVSKEQAF